MFINGPYTNCAPWIRGFRKFYEKKILLELCRVKEQCMGSGKILNTRFRAGQTENTQMVFLRCSIISSQNDKLPLLLILPSVYG
jgi:hypothetical protein